MIIRSPHQLPAEKEAKLNYLVKLEWISLGFKLSIVLVMFLAMGNSQAMQAAWLEDLLTILPPIAFLLSMHYRKRPPDNNYPYGYQRVTVIAFLCSAFALLLLGGFLVIDSAIQLLKAERTSIGGIELFGETYWLGWFMVAALTYSIIPIFILGRMKLSVAKEVHEKTVLADANMSKADWMTSAAGIVGVLGVGMGFWWTDAAAALVIGLDVSRDGMKNLREAVGDLMDRRPLSTETDKPDGLIEELELKLTSLPWVKEAAVRLREEGHVLAGEAFIVPVSNEDLTNRLYEANQELEKMDWRLLEIVITPAPELENKYYFK